MGKKIGSRVPYILLVVQGIAIAALLFYIVPYRYRMNRTENYEESQDLLQNPLIGFAPPAENEEEAEAAQLVYIGLTWAQWEPNEGEYAVEALEENYHISRWKAENKHAVLRFVCDIPDDEPHMDIPDWLYRRTGDGTRYDTSYGAGYSPNYRNRTFREAHSKAIRALADYCNESDFVAYVELGSLGHWGEWHTNTEEGVPALPKEEVCREYVKDYTDSFLRARLLMRRNYTLAAEGGLGLYNDMTGHRKSTERWLEWITEGGSSDAAEGGLDYTPLEKFWEQAPVGGELTSSIAMEEMLDRQLQDTLNLIEQTHMSFIGPKCPTDELRESSGAEAIRKRLGYRIYISGLRTQFDFGRNRLNVYLTWNNTGLAPMYWDWPVTMYVFSEDGELKYQEAVDLKLSELVPDHAVVTETHIPYTDLFRQGFRIGIGITDPEGKEHLRLAMDTGEIDNIQIIYSYEK